METLGSLRFLENPRVLMPCSWTPAGPTCQAITARRRGPRCKDDKGSHEHVIFRGSIAGPRHSLSTLRSDHRWPPRKTRFRLLAKLSRMGLVTHRIPTKGFRAASYISSSFPKLSWRKDTVHNSGGLCMVSQDLRRDVLIGLAAKRFWYRLGASD